MTISIDFDAPPSWDTCLSPLPNPYFPSMSLIPILHLPLQIPHQTYIWLSLPLICMLLTLPLYAVLLLSRIYIQIQMPFSLSFCPSQTPMISSPLSVANPSLSIDLVLSALADSSMEPAVDTGDDPSWTEALASLEREYWVVGAWEELQSLQDMQVFVLVPHSSLPPDVVLWKANLSVSVNAMILAKSFATKFGMWQWVMPNNTAWTMTRLLL